MGLFEHFPYTNFQDVNLDWILQAVKDVQKKIDDFDADIQGMVDEWLANHPEATTTVQDASLTAAKFTTDLQLETIKDYITPQMYGAVGDGMTDDAAALQAALNQAQVQGKPVALISDYYCNANLSVPSYVRVFGLSQNTERKPYIWAGPDVTTLFDMPGIINRFDDFNAANNGSTYRNFTLFDFHGNVQNDIDSVMHGVSCGYAKYAIICRGRNLDVNGCLFTHCAYGLYYDLPQTQIRGLTVKNCAFHGIGEEAALNWFEDSACIYIEQNYNCNMLVENCHSEQGGTFFKGHVTHGLFIGNFVESFKADIIEITSTSVNTLGNSGTMLWVGNSLNGKTGSVAAGVTSPLPKHAVTITNNGRIAFANNLFRRLGEEAVVLSTVFRSAFSGNMFVNLGQTDSTKAFAFKIATATHSIIQNNVALDSGITLYSASTTGSLFVKQNAGFEMPTTSSGIAYEHVRNLYPIGTTNGGTAINFTLPDRFLVSRDGTDRIYPFERYGEQFSGGFHSVSQTSWECIYFTVSGDTITPYIKLYTIGSGGTVSAVNYGSQLTFYQYVE